MNPGITVLLLVGAVTALSAQDQTTAYSWIGTNDPMRQAWVTYWIAASRDSTHLNEVERILGSPDTTSDSSAAKLAAMDALIQMGATAPLASLDSLTGAFPTEVLILAARSREDNSALLLKLLDRPFNYQAFVAIGNLLTPRRVPGFALRALKEFTVLDEISVYAPGQDTGMSGGWAGDTLGTRAPDKEGWPLVGVYGLTESRVSGSVPLAGGKHPISYYRQQNRGYQDTGFKSFGTDENHQTGLRAEEFLASYLDKEPSQMLLRAQARPKVIFKDAAQYESELKFLFRSQREAYAHLVKEVADREFVSQADAASLQLYIRTMVQDYREGERAPLPDVRAWTGNTGPIRDWR